ncbi:MAG: hypothetical protein K6F94_03510 [Bacteroidaceae bacterium]|nr:hypothetical protein [Bacteroidaceae bacterium]
MNLIDIIKPSSALDSIMTNTYETAQNTTNDVLDYLSITIAIGTALFTLFTWFSQKKTESNTSLLSMNEQKNLLIDMVRHLYRNFVVSYTIAEKMRMAKYRVYPSEEHLQKLKINMEDIHLNLFYKTDTEYRTMNKLAVMLRNYNLEIDVICKHFGDPNIDENTKQRDISTLLLKCGLLTKMIVAALRYIWEIDAEREAREQIEQAQATYNAAQAPEVEGFQPYANSRSYYTETLFAGSLTQSFLEKFNADVVAELGTNQEGGNKIHMISFKD